MRGGELLDDAHDRARRAARVQGSEHEVASLCGSQRNREGFRVAKLTYDNDIGVFSQSRSQSMCERVRIGPDLALRDDRFLAVENRFDIRLPRLHLGRNERFVERLCDGPLIQSIPEVRKSRLIVDDFEHHRFFVIIRGRDGEKREVVVIPKLIVYLIG